MSPRSSLSSSIPEMDRRALAPADVHALARELAPLVLAEILKLVERAAQPSTYSTRRGRGPTGIPDREWKRIARQIGRLPHPGARWLVVKREDYERWRDGQSVARAPAANDAEPWSAEKALAEAGLRAPRA